MDHPGLANELPGLECIYRLLVYPKMKRCIHMGACMGIQFQGTGIPAIFFDRFGQFPLVTRSLIVKAEGEVNNLIC